jgi:hypothetical protein
MNGEDFERLLDGSMPAHGVNLEDTPWLLVLVAQDVRARFESLQGTVARHIEDSEETERVVEVLSTEVQHNAIALGEVKRTQADCPMSTRKGSEEFVDKVVGKAVHEAAQQAATEAVQKANGTKPVKFGLTKSELISVTGMLVWVISALTVALISLATNGGLTIPIP